MGFPEHVKIIVNRIYFILVICFSLIQVGVLSDFQMDKSISCFLLKNLVLPVVAK